MLSRFRPCIRTGFAAPRLWRLQPKTGGATASLRTRSNKPGGIGALAARSGQVVFSAQVAALHFLGAEALKSCVKVGVTAKTLLVVALQGSIRLERPLEPHHPVGSFFDRGE